MMRANRFWTLRVSASSSVDSSTTSGTSSNSPTRYGSSRPGSRGGSAAKALHEDAQRPVGHADHLVDDRGGADLVEVVAAGRARPPGSLTVTSASIRSPATTSSISWIERSCPIASGVIDSREDDRLLQREDRQPARQLSVSAARASGSISLTLVVLVTMIVDARALGCGAIGSTIVRRPRS